jgi:deoxyadenosine/deoxycytidine kinase
MTNVIISIEGNIGSGKSTLLENLRKNLSNGIGDKKIIFIQEPVDSWGSIKDSNGITMLQKFYENQEKYAFSFQMMAFISRLAILRETMLNNPDAIIITERSLFTDKLVFAKMLFESGKIEDVNYQIYLKWFDSFAVECPVNKIIYVKANPETCHYRISKRLRVGEEGIPLKYLCDCDLYHENMLIEMKCKNELILDGNIDIHENVDQLGLWIEQIRNFIV